MALITNNISGSSSNASKIGITGSVVIGDAPDAAFPVAGSDVTFFVSGSDGKRSVFGGTTVVSGALYVEGNTFIGNSSGDSLVISGSTSILGDSFEITGSLAVTGGNTTIYGDSFEITGSLSVTGGISGSLTRLTNGTSAFVGGTGILVTSASNGAVTFGINDSVVATVSGTTFTGVFTAASSSNLGTIVESMVHSVGDTGTVAFSLSNSSVFYVNNPAGDITANFTGAPTTNDRIISTTVILSQSSTARIVSAVQVDGAASTINWSNGIIPAGNAGKQDVFGFSLIRSGSAWKTLGQMSTFG